MIVELLIILVLLVAIVVMAYYLYKCKNSDDSTKQQMASRAKPQHPAVAAYQDYLRSVSLPDYEYKMYEAYTPLRKKYEPYTLADYDKLQNCSCQYPGDCPHNRDSRGWAPSSDTI